MTAFDLTTGSGLTKGSNASVAFGVAGAVFTESNIVQSYAIKSSGLHVSSATATVQALPAQSTGINVVLFLAVQPNGQAVLADFNLGSLCNIGFLIQGPGGDSDLSVAGNDAPVTGVNLVFPVTVSASLSNGTMTATIVDSTGTTIQSYSVPTGTTLVNGDVAVSGSSDATDQNQNQIPLVISAFTYGPAVPGGTGGSGGSSVALPTYTLLANAQPIAPNGNYTAPAQLLDSPTNVYFFAGVVSGAGRVEVFIQRIISSSGVTLNLDNQLIGVIDTAGKSKNLVVKLPYLGESSYQITFVNDSGVILEVTSFIGVTND